MEVRRWVSHVSMSERLLEGGSVISHDVRPSKDEMSEGVGLSEGRK